MEDQLTVEDKSSITAGNIFIWVLLSAAFIGLVFLLLYLVDNTRSAYKQAYEHAHSLVDASACEEIRYLVSTQLISRESLYSQPQLDATMPVQHGWDTDRIVEMVTGIQYIDDTHFSVKFNDMEAKRFPDVVKKYSNLSVTEAKTSNICS